MIANLFSKKWFWVLLLPVITSCVSRPYPTDWNKLETIPIDKSQQCPSIAGFYEDYGEIGPDKNFNYDQWFFSSLSFNLLLIEEYSSLKPILHSDSHFLQDKRYLLDEIVEIRQPSDDLLEIIIWREENKERYILRQDRLYMSKGDFSCNEDGLHIKNTDINLLFVFYSVYRLHKVLNRSEDGALVMKLDDYFALIFMLIPLAGSEEYWIRWQPIKSEVSSVISE